MYYFSVFLCQQKQNKEMMCVCECDLVRSPYSFISSVFWFLLPLAFPSIFKINTRRCDGCICIPIKDTHTLVQNKNKRRSCTARESSAEFHGWIKHRNSAHHITAIKLVVHLFRVSTVDLHRSQENWNLKHIHTHTQTTQSDRHPLHFNFVKCVFFFKKKTN